MKLQNLFLMLLATAILFSCKKDDGAEPANEAPQITTSSVDTPEDTEAGTTFATIAATDPEGDEFFFSLDASETMFQITADGGLQLKTGQQFDLATTTQHTVNVTVTDEHAAESESAVTINVTEGEGETNQAPAVNNEVLEFEVSENISDDETIGTVDASDPEGQTLEYDVVSQIELIEISDSGELSLVAGEEFDYETATSHTVRVRVSDGENIVDTDFTIMVTNVIETLFEDPGSFITTWNTEGANDTISFGDVQDGFYLCDIDWGDGSQETYEGTTPPSHVYAAEGTYSIAIKYGFSQLLMDNNESAHKLISIDQWGDIQWQNFENAFEGCVNMEYNATDAPDLSQVTSLWAMFYGCSSFNGDLNNWVVGTITNMGYMFSGASSFNGDVGNWGVENVTDMSYMFSGAQKFNQNLGGWDLSELVAPGMISVFDNSGMTKESYDATLKGWADNPNTPDNITLGADGIPYCTSFVERQKLINDKGWTIDDNGLHTDCI
ncbi:BspA family leucine-rich repeat surface protein [Flagellimonas sp.]|uniref:BspA family leucine-rich repeat surface protein n=1 Tax=Flagellimonas sp. TaxID=2058762 RepID=UPI003B52CC4D